MVRGTSLSPGLLLRDDEVGSHSPPALGVGADPLGLAAHVVAILPAFDDQVVMVSVDDQLGFPCLVGPLAKKPGDCRAGDSSPTFEEHSVFYSIAQPSERHDHHITRHAHDGPHLPKVPSTPDIPKDCRHAVGGVPGDDGQSRRTTPAVRPHVDGIEPYATLRGTACRMTSVSHCDSPKLLRNKPEALPASGIFNYSKRLSPTSRKWGNSEFQPIESIRSKKNT